MTLSYIYNVSFQYSLIVLFLLRYFSVKNCEARGWLFTVDDFVMLQHRPVTVEHCFKLVAKDQRLLGLLCHISESTAADSRYVITAPGLDCNWFTHQHARTCLPSVCSGVSQRAAVDDVLWKYLSLDLCLNVYRTSRIHAGVQRFHSIKTSPWWRAVSREQVCQQDSLWLLLFIISASLFICPVGAGPPTVVLPTVPWTVHCRIQVTELDKKCNS